jgi:hypothetical protein
MLFITFIINAMKLQELARVIKKCLNISMKEKDPNLNKKVVHVNHNSVFQTSLCKPFKGSFFNIPVRDIHMLIRKPGKNISMN